MAGDKVGLGAAASALEGELRRFEQLAELAVRLELSSQKNLDRAARAAQAAEELLRDSERDGFDDAARQAQSVRQQAVSARNKLKVLREKQQ